MLKNLPKDKLPGIRIINKEQLHVDDYVLTEDQGEPVVARIVNPDVIDPEGKASTDSKSNTTVGLKYFVWPAYRDDPFRLADKANVFGANANYWEVDLDAVWTILDKPFECGGTSKRQRYMFPALQEFLPIKPYMS